MEISSSNAAMELFERDPSAVHEGRVLASAETGWLMAGDEDIEQWVRAYPVQFFEMLKLLHPLRRDELLSYFGCSKMQEDIGALTHASQTMVSLSIRHSLRFLTAMTYFGGYPSEELMADILERLRLNDDIVTGIKTSNVIEVFHTSKCSWRRTAASLNAFRPALKRQVHGVREVLLAPLGSDRAAAALGEVILQLTELVAPVHGPSRHVRFGETIKRTDPDIFGNFRINVESPGFDEIFHSSRNALNEM